MRTSLAVERISTRCASVAGVNLCEGFEGTKVGRVDGRGMTVEAIRGAEQALQLRTGRSDVVPRDEGRLGFAVEHRLNVLGLQIFGNPFALGVHETQRGQREKHDCGEDDGAQTTVLFSHWATHQITCRLRPL